MKAGRVAMGQTGPMTPDRRPLGLPFSEPATDQVLPAGQRPRLLPAERPPFLEPDSGVDAGSDVDGAPSIPVPPPARRPLGRGPLIQRA